MRWPVVLIFLGMIACSPVPSVETGALCSGLQRDVRLLRLGLEQHPSTPVAVGEPATNVTLGLEAGCAYPPLEKKGPSGGGGR